MLEPIEWRPRGVVATETVRQSSPVARFLPPEPLRDSVEWLWTISWDFRGQPPVRRETLPHPCVYLVIGAEDSGLSGVSTRRFERELSGLGRVFGVKFRPGGFRPFWPAPVHTLTDRTLALSEAFGEAGAHLRDEVLACAQAVPALERIARFLLDRLPPPDPQARLVCEIVSRILREPEIVGVDQVAAFSGLHVRQLQRLFRDYVGVGPKWVIRRYRMHDAMERMESGTAQDFAALAAELGFCDQSHFNRAFSKTLGYSPGRYPGPRKA